MSQTRVVKLKESLLQRIFFDVQSPELIPGKPTSVPITIRFDKPTKVRNIIATFHGAIHTQANYTVTKVDSKGRSKSETKTAHEYVDIVKEDFLLAGDEKEGFFSRLGDSMATLVGGGEHTVYGPGEEQFTIEICVPDDAPASFTGKKCEIFYRVAVAVDIPIAFDWNEAHEFRVGQPPMSFSEMEPVHVTFPDEEGRSFWDRTFGKPVTLNFATDRNRLSPSETALAMLTVDTPEPLKLTGIQLSMIGLEKSVARNHRDSYSHVVDLTKVETKELIDNQTVYEFEVTAPPAGDLPFTNQGKNFSVEWFAQITIEIPWAKDPTIRLPIEYMEVASQDYPVKKEGKPDKW